jgi:hypothetical protein
MAMKPNYRQERLARERNRNLKQQEKLKRRESAENSGRVAKP